MNFQLKHQKLFECVQRGKLDQLLRFNYHFSSCDVNILDHKSNSPLFYAVQKLDHPFIKFLLSLQANPNCRCSNGDSPMHMLFATNHVETIVDFLRIGVKIYLFKGSLDLVNDKGMTPLAFAKKETLEQIDMLKATVNVRMEKGGDLVTIGNDKMLGKKYMKDNIPSFRQEIYM
jgi:ankyrin repeat protein